MKQITQNMGNGETCIVEAPCMSATADTLVIHASRSLISIGTERMLVDFGKASYLQKARQQPEKVRMVLDKIKTDGLLNTFEAVKSKLDQPVTLGYCSMGVVSEVGKNVTGFKPGSRVICNGPHSEVVRVSPKLCALVPDDVDDESAVFTVVASIGLQGIRLVQPTLGESFVVMGVGLIGLLTVQLLRAHGCRVLAVDFDDTRLKLAEKFGATICNPSHEGADVVQAGLVFSRGFGVDGVLITASSRSSEPVTQAARMCRKRGRIVLVGVAGLELNRADFYDKELSFQVSCSYGPGRYEAAYEEKGLDFPIGHVRWTAQRNFEAVLDMMAAGTLDVKPLITHRYNFEEAPAAYQMLTEDKSALGVLLQYHASPQARAVRQVMLCDKPAHFSPEKPVLGVIGAGNYASRMLLPALQKSGAQFHTLVTSGGVNGVIHGKKAGFAMASTDVDSMLDTNDINTVVIVTRHDTHAGFVTKALNRHKHVFVEKPLALNLEELSQVQAAVLTNELAGNNRILMVGFNRRFSPHIIKMKAMLEGVVEPKAFIMTVNAGKIPADHWTQNPDIGGGRIIGEACHFIDLMRFLAGQCITSVSARSIGKNDSLAVTEDNVAITLGFADGSTGTIHYLANGASTFPKERIEVFAAGRILQLDNFRVLRGYGWPDFKKMALWKQDKGQLACARAFLSAITAGAPSPIPFNELVEVARVTIEAATEVRSQL